MAQIINLVLTPITLTPAEDPDLCRFHADFKSIDGKPLYRMRIDISQNIGSYGSTVYSDNWIGSHVVYYTDSEGHAEFDLVRGLVFRVRFGATSDIWSNTFTCPDQSSALLLDYIFPYVTDISIDETSFSLDVGESVSVTVTGTYSNGETFDASGYVVLAVGDEDVVSLSGHVLTGVSAGSTTVSIDSVDGDGLPGGMDILGDSFLALPSPTYVIGAARPVVISA